MQRNPLKPKVYIVLDKGNNNLYIKDSENFIQFNLM